MLRLRSLAAALLVLLVAGSASGRPPARKGPWSDLPRRVGVIIVLGFGHTQESRPTWHMVQRVGRAVEAYHRGLSRVILVCGGYTTGHVAEAEEMKVIAQAMGVPARHIVMERNSQSTEGNAKYAARIAHKRGFRSGLLVTHRSHMKRARRTFRRRKVVPELYSLTADSFSMDDFPWPELPKALQGQRFDAIVVHGGDPGTAPMREDPMVSPTTRQLAFTLAALTRGGIKSIPIFLHHRPTAIGRIPRSEVMGLAAIAFGVHASRLIYALARRNGPKERRLWTAIETYGWKRVLAILPTDRLLESEDVAKRYAEKGVEAVIMPAYHLPRFPPPRSAPPRSRARSL